MKLSDKIINLENLVTELFKRGFYVKRECSCKGVEIKDISLTKKEGYIQYLFSERNDYNGSENNFERCITHFTKWLNPSCNNTILDLISSYIDFNNAQIRSSVNFDSYHSKIAFADGWGI